MPAAFGPVIPATSRVTVMLVYAEETPSDFAREVPEGTRYVVKSVAAHPPFPGTFSCHLVQRGVVWLRGGERGFIFYPPALRSGSGALVALLLLSEENGFTRCGPFRFNRHGTKIEILTTTAI